MGDPALNNRRCQFGPSIFELLNVPLTDSRYGIVISGSDTRSRIRKFGWPGTVRKYGLLLVFCRGLSMWIYQFGHGLIVTDMRDNVLPGLYIASFNFLVGLSFSGTLISAILRLTGVRRSPVPVCGIRFTGINRWRRKLYEVLSLNWQGPDVQPRILNRP